VLASVVLGLGFSFYSGAVEAWLVDALGATGSDGPLDPVFARGSIVSGAAMVLGSVGGGQGAARAAAAEVVARLDAGHAVFTSLLESLRADELTDDRYRNYVDHMCTEFDAHLEELQDLLLTA
jgi:hypothetical protein